MAGRRLEAGSLPLFLHSLSDGILSWHLMHETIKIKTTLSQRLTTPLQIEQYLTLAFEEAYRVGQKPVTPEIIETTLAQGLEDLEPPGARRLESLNQYDCVENALERTWGYKELI